jgi:hypothetical protein
MWSLAGNEISENPKLMKTPMRNLFIALAIFAGLGSAGAQVNYAISGNTAYVTSSPNAAGNIVISNTYAGYPVTSIATSTFFDCTSLTSITIGTNVTSIGDSAFYYCSALTSITIPNSVTSIGDDALVNCSGLTSVTIPNSVISIGDDAFVNCSGLTNVAIPASVTSIGDDAFVNCSGLTNIAVNAGNASYASVGGVLFNKAMTTLIQYPIRLAGSYAISNSVTSIGDNAFVNCSGLTSVTIPNSVTSIGDYAFSDCYRLTNVTIGNSVTNIGGSAFAACSGLTNVTIPASVTSIGEYAFNCSGLTNIAVNAGNASYASAGGVLFNKALTTLIQCPAGLAGSYVISNSVTSIGDDAFYYSSLTSVTIPDSTTSIGGEAFYECSGLTNVTIGNSVTSIGDYAFFGSGLTRVTIPASVTSIGYFAFFYCSGLHQAYFQGNAPSVNGGPGSADTSVFLGDSGTAYYLPGTTGWGSTFGGFPTAFWVLPNPLTLNNGLKFGPQNNQFGFTISWTSNATVVVEASATLAHPIWSPVSTNTLTATLGTSTFSDPHWTNYPSRFYRLRSP